MVFEGEDLSRRDLQKPPIGGEDLRAETSSIEAGEGSSASVGGQMSSEGGCIGKLLDPLGKRGDISGREADGIVIVSEKLLGAARFRDDHRLGASHGFHDRAAKGFRLRAGV